MTRRVATALATLTDPADPWCSLGARPDAARAGSDLSAGTFSLDGSPGF